MRKFDSLEYDVKMMLKGDHAPESLEVRTSTAHSIVKLAKNVATHTLEMVSHKPREPKDFADRSIRMSEMGTPCHRQLMYKWYQPELGNPPFAQNPEPYLPVKFTFGDYIEELTLFICGEAGHAVTDRQKEVRLCPELTDWYAVGHMDAKVDNVIVDVKSAADGSFSKYKREGLSEETDTFGYLWQIDGYAMAEGTQERAFIFTNKHDGNLYILDRSDIPYLPVEDMIARIGEHAENWMYKGTLPERMPTKATKYGSQLGTVCSYCNFKYSCYDGDVTGVISSGRPMYFVGKLTDEGEKFAKDKASITKPEAYAKA